MRIESKDWPELERAVFYGEVKTFLTKSEALGHGRDFGWPHAFRLLRRFEHVWIVGKKDFQNDVEVGLPFGVIRVPLLRWDVKNGIEICPVVKFRKHIPLFDKGHRIGGGVEGNAEDKSRSLAVTCSQDCPAAGIKPSPPM